MHRVLVVNGPNLNLLGVRRPEIYGSTRLVELDELCRQWGRDLGMEVTTFQSNHEGEIIDQLHAMRERLDGLVINPGALSHTSYAIHDAIEAVGVPAVEVHISDIDAREEWRRHSVTAPACVGQVKGQGVVGYRLALEQLDHHLASLG